MSKTTTTMEQIYEGALVIAALRIVATTLAVNPEHALWRDGGSYRAIAAYINRRRLRASGIDEEFIENVEAAQRIEEMVVGGYTRTRRA